MNKLTVGDLIRDDGGAKCMHGNLAQEPIGYVDHLTVEWLQKCSDRGLIQPTIVKTSRDEFDTPIYTTQSVKFDADVTKILLAVVPGADGMGHEVYAKSVADVVDILNQQGQRIEELESHLANARGKQALPNIELVAAAVHQAWIDTKLAAGIPSRPAADGREQMVPYSQLDDDLQELDRATVRAVYKAIERTRSN